MLGGIVSFLLKIFLLFYVYYNFKKMFLYEDDKTYNNPVLLDLVEHGTVNYNETEQFIFFTLAK